MWCRQRPCGEISARFRVLNRQWEPIGSTTATKCGLHGERLRLVVLSSDPQADQFELERFSAQAMVIELPGGWRWSH